MRESRLALALSTGAAVLPPEGEVAVFYPGADDDLAPIGPARAQIIQPFRPDHDAWAARGYRVAPQEPEGARFCAAVVFLPRARALAQALVARALAVAGGGPVLIDGRKTDGVDAMLKACRARATVEAPLSGGHGKLFALHAAPGAFADWAGAPVQLEGGFCTAPGVFSAERVDPGSALLGAALPAELKGRVADLGAGWGYLAATALARCPGIAELHLIEADAVALGCARANVPDSRARFHWADALAFSPERRFDAVITNPPFHTGRAATPALGLGFLGAAAGLLAPHGALYAVANRHLPYERGLKERFATLEEIGGNGAFKLLRATRPLRVAGARR